MNLPVFDYANAADVRQLFGAPALQSSEHSRWDGLSFELRSGEAAFSTVEHVVENHYFMVKLDPGTRAERRLDGRWYPETQRHGFTAFVPHGCPHETRYPHKLGSLYMITVGRSVVDSVCAELGMPGFQGVPAPALCADSLLLATGHQIAQELARGNPCGQLFADITAQSLALYLVSRQLPASRPRLPVETLAAHRLRRVDEYIEANIDAQITLQDLAEVAGLSVFHFSRAFKAAAQRTPYQHVLAKKIARAEHLLAFSELPLVEIALAVGFVCQYTFTRQFRKSTGITPAAFRRGGKIIRKI